MPTTGIVSGSKLRLMIETVNVARATSCSFNTKNDLRQTSHKDQTGGFATSEYGEFSGDMSTDFLVEEVAGGLEDLMVLYLAKTKVDFIYGTGVSGDIKISGTALIESMSIDAANKENAKASIKLVTDGTITLGAYA